MILADWRRRCKCFTDRRERGINRFLLTLLSVNRSNNVLIVGCEELLRDFGILVELTNGAMGSNSLFKKESTGFDAHIIHDQLFSK